LPPDSSVMTDSPSRTAARRHVLVYDGECGVCLRSVRLLRGWDRGDRIEMAPFQSEGVMDRFPRIPEDEFREAVQLIAPDGRRWSGADAVERALALTPRGRPIAWLFRLPFARHIARRAYRWFARNRGRFARFA
jgi:acetyl esterase